MQARANTQTRKATQARRCRARMRRFAREDRGGLAVEAIAMLPLLLWAFLATYAFFDGYRMNNVNYRAAFTVADALSRETREINEAYMDSVYGMLQFLADGEHEMKLRVTNVRFNEDDDVYEVRWSSIRGNWEPLTNTGLQELSSRIPELPGGNTVILVESRMVYEPIFRMGLVEPVEMEAFIVTRPRFAPQLKWAGTS